MTVLFYVNTLFFQQWKSNWDILFFNSSFSKPGFKTGIFECGFWVYFSFFTNSRKRDWKFAFIVDLVWSSIFSNSWKRWNIDFCMLAWAVFPNLSQFTKELENRNFWILRTFIFCQIVRILFEARYVSSRGRSNLWLNFQFSRKKMFIFMRKICVKLSAGNTVSKLNWR